MPIGVYSNGNIKFKRYTCATRAEARAMLRAAQEALECGADLGAKTQMLGAYLDTWLAQVVRRDVEPKTYEGYVYTAGLITSTLGKVPLDKLTPQLVQKLLNELREGAASKARGCRRARCSTSARPCAVPSARRSSGGW